MAQQDIATGAPRARRWGRSGKLAVALPLVAVLALMPLLIDSRFYLHVGNLACINVILVLSLSLIARIGQLSLCHAAFAGVGAYATAMLSTRAGVPPLLGILVGSLLAGLVAMAIGAVILRVRGVYFVLVTFLFGQIFTLALLDVDGMTGGANGIVGIPAIKLFGISFGAPSVFYYLVFGFALLTFVFLYALLRSQTGRAFAAIEENLQLAEASGIDTKRYQLLAFSLGSALAGLGGGLLAHYIHFISPETFTFWESVAYIVMLVVGGRASLVGAVIGVAFLTPLPELLRDAEAFQNIIYGAILILVLMFLPDGLVTLPARLRRLFGRKRGGPDAAG